MMLRIIGDYFCCKSRYLDIKIYIKQWLNYIRTLAIIISKIICKIILLISDDVQGLCVQNPANVNVVYFKPTIR